MIKKLIYSCVFFNYKYIELISLLLKSYILFGNPSNDIDYLIICSPKFKNDIQNIFNKLKINGKIWCLDLNTLFESAYSRLKIFDYEDIDLYNKILYLDCDILITNSIDNILNFQLEDKIYCLQEGCCRNFHFGLFNDEEYNLLDKSSAFSSGIILFNNSVIIKDLFLKTLTHIYTHINNKLSIPHCLDQPFIIYHAINNNLYNNTKLIGICINNPNTFNNQTISHYCGGPGHYESKISKMSYIMNFVMFNVNKNNQVIPDNQLLKNTSEGIIYSVNTHLLNKPYKWKNSTITFLENGNMNAFGIGKYNFIDTHLVKCVFGNQQHLLKFNQDFSLFISVRKNDFEVVSGTSQSNEDLINSIELSDSDHSD